MIPRHTNSPGASDTKYWRKVGIKGGYRNEPRTADGPSPARTLIQSAWRTELSSHRLEFLKALGAVDARRVSAQRQLREVRAQAAADPRQATALPMLMARDVEIANERRALCEKYLNKIETTTQRFLEYDAVWRAANEANRDRRLSIEPTDLTAPAEVMEIPADPFA